MRAAPHCRFCVVILPTFVRLLLALRSDFWRLGRRHFLSSLCCGPDPVKRNIVVRRARTLDVHRGRRRFLGLAPSKILLVCNARTCGILNLTKHMRYCLSKWLNAWIEASGKRGQGISEEVECHALVPRLVLEGLNVEEVDISSGDPLHVEESKNLQGLSKLGRREPLDAISVSVPNPGRNLKGLGDAGDQHRKQFLIPLRISLI
mmetsp:Transcript_11859/g.18612  ORF Transcript_11859/g.18612 Transcript_11859/m.18612 type:complete len:205 (+) Transcript_11859:142-756(+)